MTSKGINLSGCGLVLGVLLSLTSAARSDNSINLQETTSAEAAESVEQDPPEVAHRKVYKVRHAEAQEGGHSEAHEGGHHAARRSPHHRYHAGFTGVALGGFAGRSEATHLGMGVFFEVLVIPRWMEVEVGARVITAEAGVAVPIDLLIKKPFHVTKWFHPFVGIGPSLVPTISGEGRSFHAGGATTVGAHFWVNSDLALLAEFNDNLLYDHGLVNEAGGAAGLVIGW